MKSAENLTIIILPIKDITPDPENAKEHPKDQIEQIKTSIQKFGMCDPIGVWGEQNLIVEGHGRWLALSELGYTEAPCIRLDELTEEERKEYALIHNQTTLNSGFNLEKLYLQLPKLNIPFMQGFGFTIPTAPVQAEEDSFDVSEAINEITEPITKPGDVWLLGRHRLICGDCTKSEVLEKLMKGERADLLQTDPPYNVNYNGKTEEKLTIENDNLADEEFRELLKSAFKYTQQFLKVGASFYVWHASRSQAVFEEALIAAGLQPRQQLIWVKNSITLGRQDYQWKHEPCFYGWKEGAPHRWYGDRKQTTVLEYDKPQKNEEHPTMKPIPLIGYQIWNSTKKDDIVLDVFGGSGSTLNACEQLERVCRMVEISPKNCDVIVKRWEQLTGEKAVKEV